MLTGKYTFKDKGIRDVLSGVSRLTSARIRVGVVGPGANTKHPTSGLSVWEIGALQEFGSKDGHIPPRSFIRSTLADTGWVKQIVSQAARQVVMQGKSANAAMNWAGGVIANQIRKTVLSDVGPANAQKTIDWKGHSHTLLGLTSALFDAIGHVVIDAVIGDF